MAGATAVQVGTASFANPRALLDVIEGVERWCGANGVSDVNDVIGAALPRVEAVALSARRPFGRDSVR